MTDTNHIVAPTDCMGCGLCANVCSRDAIKMTWSEDGFLIPQVNTELCINCGLCVKRCPALNKPPKADNNTDGITAYGAWCKDKDTLLESSSGGVFTCLAERTIAEGGVVYGVVWKDKLTAVFDSAETVEELRPMRGSKYTGANVGKIYQHVKAQLIIGRKVFFAGTNCQIYALKQYLRKDYENLLTAEILCHGAPSHLILRKYIQEAEDATGKTIDHISFRDKVEGWKNFHVRKYYTDGSSESCSQRKDLYMRIFLSDKALNLACYSCIFREFPRRADITLGDYWGVKHEDWPIAEGISAVLAHTDKGRQALEGTKSALNLHEEPFDSVCDKQSHVYILKHHPLPEARDKILYLLKTAPLKTVFSKVMYAIDLGFVHISYRSGLYKLWRKIFK